MMLFVKNLGENQYHAGHGGQKPPFSPKNGWKKGQKYTTITREMYKVDSVDVSPKSGELKLYVSRVR